MNVAIKPQRIYGTVADAAVAIHNRSERENEEEMSDSRVDHTGVTACAFMDKINSYIVTSYIDLGASIHAIHPVHHTNSRRSLSYATLKCNRLSFCKLFSTLASRFHLLFSIVWWHFPTKICPENAQ